MSAKAKWLSRMYCVDSWWHYSWIFSLHERRVRTLLETNLLELNNSHDSKHVPVRVLDVGCGPRKSMRETILYAGADYVGVDIYPAPDHLMFNGKDLPFESQSFDIVICMEVLEHAELWEELLADIFRVISKSGRVIITLPFLFPVHGAPSDFRRLTTFGINNAIEKSGGVVIRTDTVGGIGSFLTFPILGWRFGGLNKNSRPILRVISILLAPVFLLAAPLANMLALLMNKIDNTELFFTQSVTTAKASSHI